MRKKRAFLLLVCLQSAITQAAPILPAPVIQPDDQGGDGREKKKRTQKKRGHEVFIRPQDDGE